jgi:hypothetical protein
MLQWLMRRRNEQRHPNDQRHVLRHELGGKRSRALDVSVGVTGWPALIRDISSAGVGLIVGQRHPPGAQISAKILDSASDLKLQVRLRVVHVERRSDGNWNTGCTFEPPLLPQHLSALL